MANKSRNKKSVISSGKKMVTKINMKSIVTNFFPCMFLVLLWTIHWMLFQRKKCTNLLFLWNNFSTDVTWCHYTWTIR